MANDNHSFSIEDAKKHGVEKALIINHFRFFLKCHQSNGTHQYDGYTWAYNTAKSLNELMPYLNTKSIQRWLVELEQDGILKSGNYNKLGIDKTKWYTMPEFAITQKVTPITQNEESKTQNEVTIPIHTTIQTTSKREKSAPAIFTPNDYYRAWDIPFAQSFLDKLKLHPNGETALKKLSEAWETFCQVRCKAHNKRYHTDISEAQALSTFLSQCKGAAHAIESLKRCIAVEAINPFVVEQKTDPNKKGYLGIELSRLA